MMEIADAGSLRRWGKNLLVVDQICITAECCLPGNSPADIRVCTLLVAQETPTRRAACVSFPLALEKVGLEPVVCEMFVGGAPDVHRQAVVDPWKRWVIEDDLKRPAVCLEAVIIAVLQRCPILRATSLAAVHLFVCIGSTPIWVFVAGHVLTLEAGHGMLNSHDEL